jgi:hypothetical protein
MDQFAGRNDATGGAVAAGVFDDGEGDAFAATQGAVLRAGYSADLVAPDLARQASQAIMERDFETGCARATEALRAGPQLIDALMVSGQCELHRGDTAAAAGRIDAALRSERATPDDFMTVAGIWSQLAERSRAEDALAAGGRRFGPDRFYVERINIAGEFDDLTAVRVITEECQGSQVPEVRDSCTRRQAQLIDIAAEEARRAGAQAGEGNPLSSLLRSGQNALGRLTGADEPQEDASAAQGQQEQEQSTAPPPDGSP